MLGRLLWSCCPIPFIRSAQNPSLKNESLRVPNGHLSDGSRREPAAVPSFGNHGSLTEEYSRLNVVPFLLGVAVVGLETGYIYAYKAGWPVSAASIVQSAFLAAALVLVGAWLYREPVTWNKLVGIAFCMIGLAFLNYK